MHSINSLLAKRNTQLLGEGGDEALALSRLELSKMLARSYKSFNSLRLHLESQSQAKSGKREARKFEMNAEVKALLKKLIAFDYIKKIGTEQYKYINHDARAYLAGGWLEEFIFCAMQETNPDEVLYQQKVQWQVGEVNGKNEIDVIARKGDVLSLISCKACHWNYRSHNQGDRDKLKSFLLETDYWDTHFSAGTGRAVLVVTQDLIDEANNHTRRSPTIFARADIMNVDIVSLDFFKWDVLVKRLKKHWD
jgi:hypothetical protein